ncbi:acyltransferase [Aphanothece hegewaldii CCALA 016]|uniref:Acyltransferase n=1 Tax=Aphanothece hegewaldii CCALA 016 TaxID=2107694 RepID=A0A2T1M1Q3_9CHRO|nr:acyltransferase [Aphanothece hegewaldii]PSF38646.1 acyltransferase [Aphanothece hegewaldii CCALA 016]
MHLQKLDAIRGLAACYVVVYHIITPIQAVPPLIKDVFFSFGQEAVILFFLLSGFVIAYSVYKKQNITFKDYFIKRFRRIYFPFIISIILSILIFAVQNNLSKEFKLNEFLGNLFMLQDFGSVKPGTWFHPFLKNYPLWSLSYEWWFYMLFFPCYKLLPKQPVRIYFILGLSALALINYMIIPNQVALWLSYFIIWWSGVEAASIWMSQKKYTWKNMTPIIFSLFFMTALITIPVLNTEKLQFGYYPFVCLRHFATATIAVSIGLLWYKNKLKYFDNLFGVFTLIAPISYGIYIFHYPILEQLNLQPIIPNIFINYIIKLLLILGLSYWVEIKLQPLVNKWIK